MPRSYAAPSLVHYGSVTSLTASFFKCTPGPDAVLNNPDQGVIGIQPGGPGTPIFDQHGNIRDPDGCTYR